jgi:hypothetical protein
MAWHRHAGWKAPVGEAREAAIAELRDVAGGRTDLLAEAAGVCRGFELTRAGDLVAEQYRIKADLLVEAGAVPALLDRWIEIGQERAKPTGTYPV